MTAAPKQARRLAPKRLDPGPADAAPPTERPPAPKAAASRRPPSTRSECKSGPRPCPHSTCAHHLLTEVRRFNPGATVEALADSCCLDLADAGGASPERVARALGVSPQAVSQTEHRALERIRSIECAPEDEGEVYDDKPRVRLALAPTGGVR